MLLERRSGPQYIFTFPKAHNWFTTLSICGKPVSDLFRLLN
jgi:hypothetical protein